MMIPVSAVPTNRTDPNRRKANAAFVVLGGWMRAAVVGVWPALTWAVLAYSAEFGPVELSRVDEADGGPVQPLGRIRLCLP